MKRLTFFWEDSGLDQPGMHNGSEGRGARGPSTIATMDEQQQHGQHQEGVENVRELFLVGSYEGRHKGIGILPDEVLNNILARVSSDTGNVALRCMEVCKRWRKEMISSVVRLDMKAHMGLRHFMQGVLSYESLTHLTMQECQMSKEGWSGLEERCRHLVVIRLEVSPPLNNSDLSTLLRGRSSSLEHLQIVRCLDSDEAECLENMTSLRTLDLTESRNLPSLPSLHALTNLTALCLRGCSALQSVPGLEDLAHLCDLDLTSCFSLDVPHPQLLCHMSLLETLALSSPNLNNPVPKCTWFEFTRLYPPHPRNDAEKPYALCELPRLRHFSFTDSPHARDLPNLHHLSGSLLSVSISDCGLLTTIAPLTKFQTLRKLHINLCDHVHDWLPISLLTSLQELSITQCRGLRALRITPGLANLTSLDLSRCPLLQDVHSLPLLTALRVLDLSACRSLRSLQDLEQLSALEDFHFKGCQALTRFPPLYNLPSLRNLDAYHSHFVQACTRRSGELDLRLPSTLQSLQLSLNERNPAFLTPLPGLKDLALEGLVSTHWLPQWLPSLSGVHRPSLLSVKIYSSLSLTTAPLRFFSTLQKLHFSHCSSLRSLPDLAALPDLQDLSLTECKSITAFPAICGLRNLTSLVLSRCTVLERIPSIAVLPSLSTLQILSCTSLKVLPSLDGLPSLRLLDLSRCSALESLPDLSSLQALRDLILFGCQQLPHLPSLAMLTSLEKIDLSFCSGLTSVPALDGLVWLREICVPKAITVHGAPRTADITIL